MKKSSIYLLVVFGIILSSLVFILGINRRSYNDSPIKVFEVYLKGKKLGVIEDENELYDLIDDEQKVLKKQYNVDKIWAPRSLETTEVITYDKELDDVKDVYEKIKNVEPFTVKGYVINISKTQDNEEKTLKLNVLNMEDFDTAIKNTIEAFVDKEKYEAYLNNSQEKIKTVGELIKDIHLLENITTKESYLSVDEKIFTSSNELSKYLLFGTLESQGTHIVSSGETLKDIADEYEMNVNELLIVNPQLTSENSLLFNGQTINIGLINPQVSVVVENELIEDKEVQYSKEVKYDNRYIVGTSYIEQSGQNGLSRVSYNIETINGTMTQVIPTNSEVIVPTINEVVVKGGLSTNYLGETGNFAWPTLKPYKITSYFGWRTDPVYGGRDYHSGIDIAGLGYGSPIFAAQNGIILSYGYRSDMGNHVYIKHDENYVTIYMHLQKFESIVKEGYVVTKGEKIGEMGSTGKSTGPHLHFTVEYKGSRINPLSLKYD